MIRIAASFTTIENIFDPYLAPILILHQFNFMTIISRYSCKKIKNDN